MRRLRWVWACGAVVFGASCDALLTEPGPAAPEITVGFAFEDASEAGIARAFDRVNRVFLRFARPDGASRDTIVRVVSNDGLARARLVLDAGERVSALGVFAQLRVGETPLFEGERVVKVEVGTPTSVEIPLSAVPGFIRADRRQFALASPGDTVRLSADLLFASGDTLASGVGQWTSLDPQVVAVTPAGLAVGRAPGLTGLVVRFETLSDTVEARVTGGGG